MTYSITIEGSTPAPTPTPTPTPSGKKHTIAASSYSGGSISPSGNVTVKEGESQTFIITPKPGYIVSDVKIDSAWIGPRASYTFTNVRDDHTIQASFAVKD